MQGALDIDPLAQTAQGDHRSATPDKLTDFRQADEYYRLAMQHYFLRDIEKVKHQLLRQRHNGAN